MANTPKKVPVVMQIVPELGPGGAPQGCLDVAAALVQAGAQALVVSNGGPRVHELARCGAQHIQLPADSKNPWTMLRNARRLRKLIQQYNIDIVHARSRAPAWSAWKACLSSEASYMTTCHAPYNISGKAKRFYNSSIARGERVIAISRHVADYLLKNYKVDERDIRIVPRGIPLEKFHPTAVTAERMINLSKEWRLPDGASVVLLPARLTRWKGHMVLINAMARLNRPDVFCVMIGAEQGRKTYRQELEEAIRNKNLEGSVRIVDHCNDMPAAYMLATAVVSASTDPEGFGRVPVEAQAMGRPVIATDHGGAQETILRGETGWLIPPDDAGTLAQAISEALALTPSQRAILATCAMSHVAHHFTREIMVANTLAVYDELLKKKGKPVLSDRFSQAQAQTQGPAPALHSLRSAAE